MSFKALLVAKAAVCLAFGPVLVLAPGWLLGILGASLGPGGMFTAREYGAALFGVLLLTWLARDTTAADARRAILVALLVYDAIGFVVTSVAVVSRVLNPLGWGIAVVYLAFTVGPAYLLLQQGSAEAGTA